jgi:hypothetical protein
MAWKDISGIAGVITDSQHGTKTSIPFAHHGDYAHKPKVDIDLEANRPAAGVANRIFISKDTLKIWFDTGTAWTLVGELGGLSLPTHASRHDIGGADAIPGLASHKARHAQGGADEVVGIALQGTTLPTAGVAGRFFIKTDTLELYYDNGTAWVKIGKLAGLDLSAHKSRHEKGGADEVKALGSITLDDATLASLTADPTLAKGKLWYRSDLSRIRYSPDGTSVISIDPPLTAADVWGYSTRTLTQTKFPFWSAIITQTQGTLSVAADSTAYVSVQPASGETWLVWFDTLLDYYTGGSYAAYEDYDGTTARLHIRQYTGGTYGDDKPHISVLKVLTNSLYARLSWNNAYSAAVSAYYGYSGFKLSQPLWAPKRLNILDIDPQPWKKTKTSPLPSSIAALDKYAYDILGIDPLKPNDYALGIILEEDTPLAVDPATNFSVERYTAVVEASVLADFIAKFKAGKADPVATGYAKYLKRWKTEGVDFGIPGV